jgi:hypothetical protein
MWLGQGGHAIATPQRLEMGFLRQSAVSRDGSRVLRADIDKLSAAPAREFAMLPVKGLLADLVPCIVARDNNVGEYAVPSLRCATTAALA